MQQLTADLNIEFVALLHVSDTGPANARRQFGIRFDGDAVEHIHRPELFGLGIGITGDRTAEGLDQRGIPEVQDF